MKILGIILLAAIASAQTSVGVAPPRCAGDAVQVVMAVPVSLGATTVSIPLCVALGPGLALDTSTAPPRLVVAVPAPPRVVVEKFTPPPGLPAEGTWTLTLRHEPVGAIVASFRSSRVGGDTVEIVTPGGGAAPKELQIALPKYSLTAGDSLSVLYWTTER